jgi:hypothetical protein
MISIAALIFMALAKGFSADDTCKTGAAGDDQVEKGSALLQSTQHKMKTMTPPVEEEAAPKMLQRKSDQTKSHKDNECTDKCFDDFAKCTKGEFPCYDALDKCMGECEVPPMPEGNDEDAENEGPDLESSMLQKQSQCFTVYQKCNASGGGHCAKSLYQCMKDHRKGSAMLQHTSHKDNECTDKCFDDFAKCTKGEFPCYDALEQCFGKCDVPAMGEGNDGDAENEGPDLESSMLQKKSQCFTAYRQCNASGGGDCGKSLYWCMQDHIQIGSGVQ